MGLAEVLAIYGAALSSALALIKIAEFRAASRRIVLSVYLANLVGEGERPADTPTYVMINVGNQGPMPLEITQIGFGLNSGASLIQLNPLPPFPQLPVVVQSSSGVRMGFVPGKLAEALAAKPGRKPESITRVFCSDGSSREYARSLSKGEREAICTALGEKL